MPNQRQIAKLCNVSPMTVSAVLNNRSGEYSEETRERVLEAVRQIGYRPRAALRTSARSKPDAPTVHAIAVAIPNDYSIMISPGYGGEIFRAILSATHRLGVDILMPHGSIYSADSYQSIRTHFDGHCDGLIMMSPLRSAPLVSALWERGYPCVLIGNTGDFPEQSSVDVDSALGIQMGISYLLKLRHRRIGFIGGAEYVGSANTRHLAYRRELEKAGIAYDPEIVQVGAVRMNESYQFVAELMQRKDRKLPTAFVCWNDTAARRAINALRDLGRAVPEEVSVIGFDDAAVEVHGHPELTTIRQPYREIGATAVGMLMELIQKPGSAIQGKLIPPTFVLRDSVAPAHD